MSDNNDDMWLWLAVAACAALLMARASKLRQQKDGDAVIESYAEPQQPHCENTESEQNTTTQISNEQHTENDIFNPWWLGFRRNSLGGS